MYRPEIVGIDFHQPDELTRAAAELLVASLMYVDTPGTENEVRTCLDYHQRRSGEEHYGLVAADVGLVAAATAMHGLWHESSFGETYTYVGQIAVAVAERKKGYGRQLMDHIMGQAAARGDSYAELAALEPGFFSKLGFVDSGNYMRANLLQAA